MIHHTADDRRQRRLPASPEGIMSKAIKQRCPQCGRRRSLLDNKCRICREKFWAYYLMPALVSAVGALLLWALIKVMPT